MRMLFTRSFSGQSSSRTLHARATAWEGRGGRLRAAPARTRRCTAATCPRGAPAGCGIKPGHALQPHRHPSCHYAPSTGPDKGRPMPPPPGMSIAVPTPHGAHRRSTTSMPAADANCSAASLYANGICMGEGECVCRAGGPRSWPAPPTATATYSPQTSPAQPARLVVRRQRARAFPLRNARAQRAGEGEGTPGGGGALVRAAVRRQGRHCSGRAVTHT